MTGRQIAFPCTGGGGATAAADRAIIKPWIIRSRATMMGHRLARLPATSNQLEEEKRPGISPAFFDRYNPRGALAKRAKSQIGRTITAPSRK
jgi:hypothetical protein